VKAISAAARRHLRALGHHLDPVVHCGKEGVSTALVAAVDSALGTHELIKVRISENAEGDRHDLAEAIAKATASELVEVLGRTLLLYRQHPRKPKITLPSAKTKRAVRAPSKSDPPPKK
jgi:RNA-binding protein